ncbi:MATE family efflux transporter [Ancylomarina sp. 16SWW S1-10-2]|uniref:MATE family efflux transporter n=1 Tax=Ancylomarina sp. 16SWW S1-10-2 TaxID=2499681 RepID=UPI0012AE372A|nr:MATE family efflux transporter [Ancylomarina sp. 16SWW S1-10-2]MRT93179.1 MATE family efflux transporter [Ancylomarina sp. 16SWW S1-10-2]
MKDFTTGNVARHIFNFTLPMLLGNVFQQLYNIVDSIIVGKVLGKEALASVGASFPIIFTLIALLIGIGSGFSIVISQFYGAKDIDRVKRSIDTMYIFLFISALIMSILGIYFSKDLFRLLQLPEELMPQAITYLNIYMSGMILFFGFNGTSSILRGLGDSKTPLYFLILSSILNIAFDLLFVMVFRWGIAGAAWATVLAQGIAFVSILLYLNNTHKIMKFSVAKLRFDTDLFKKSLKIGLPSGLQQTFVAVGMMTLLGIVNTFGTDVIAAYTAAGRIDSLAMMPAMNFAQALATFVGQNLGANKIDRVKKGFKATFIMSNLFCLIMSALIILFGSNLMRLFTTDPQVIEIGQNYLIIVSSFYLIFSSMFTIQGVLRGAGDTLIPMFITLFSLWIIRIPAAYFLSNEIGSDGIWWSIPMGWSIGMTCSYIYYRMGRWKTKAVTNQ